MSRALHGLAATVLAALAVAGCSGGGGQDDPVTVSGSPGGGTGGGATAPSQDRAVRFATCMREHGVPDFPDPDPSGELTLDGVVNGSSIDTDSPAWTGALRRCRDLQPAGFAGRRRSSEQQEGALRFAQCMREHGVSDFPDPTPGAPLIDTSRIPSARGRGAREIPGFTAATDACMTTFGDQVGLRRP
ncbi:hypothetical protein [Conexibacter sp. SYSU D00693]|uniref:hypothetical protein n=1 Tax=Conexibacter sp. SYSU D00693 TaxID=2812560 RepID=UPI00196B0352|nr:hypothetical protein [Conexibacter sp. SYSU D00693]